MKTLPSPRILLVDDTTAIDVNFRKILTPDVAAQFTLSGVEAALFGEQPKGATAAFEIDSAHQGQEALAMLQAAMLANRPYAMAFIDMRMSPGLDGVETIEQLWQADSRLQVVICAAPSDHSLAKVLGRLGTNDQLMILKKPFDAIEVVQMAHALTIKWQMTQQAAAQKSALEVVARERTVEVACAKQALQGTLTALQDSDARYWALVEASPDAILIKEQGCIVFANSAASGLFGASQPDALIGRAMLTLVARSDRAEAAKAVGELALGKAPRMVEEQALRLDGSTVDVAVTRLLFNFQGRPAIQVVARDISESQRLHVQLKHLTTHDALTGLPNRVLLMDRMGQTLASAKRHSKQCMVALIDLDRFKAVNDRLGHEAGDNLLRTMSHRISSSLRESDTLARVAGDEFVVVFQEAASMDNAMQILDRIVSLVSEPVVFEDGNDIAISCSVGCSTYPDDGLDAEGLLRAAGAAMCQAKESGRNKLQIFNADLRSRAASRASLQVDPRHAVERDGPSLSTLEDAVAERTRALTCANEVLQTEINERKHLQGQLVQSAKLASIGQLAAGVAHEINNPIGYVFSNLGALEGYHAQLFEMLATYEQAERSISTPDVAARLKGLREALDLAFLKEDIPILMRESKQGIARVRQIVQDLRDFSRVDSNQEWQWANLHQGIDSTLDVAVNEIKYKADVIKEYGQVPDIECLPSQINQVVLNLVVNAVHSMGEQRGCITLRTGTEGEQVWFEVSDNGSGIEPETLNRIFDPFFTTKPVGKGVGLGLSLSYGIVQKHQGRIEVNSVVGRGSSFRVTLPACRAKTCVEESEAT
ncbi:MAG: diguanylate cyclase [Burkholderiales bacterium]